MKTLFGSLCVLALFSLSFSAFATEPYWNQFRGPNSDNRSASTGIATSWSEGGPKLLWKAEAMGSGWSTVSIYGDKLFTMGDFNTDGGVYCYVIAVNRKTGDEIWKTRIGRGGTVARDRYSGPLGTPATDGESVFALSQMSDFVALNFNDGSIRWRMNTADDLGAVRMAGWGFSMSPILDGDKVLLPVGGEGGTLAAFNKSDGALLWRTDWITDRAAYTSAVPVVIEGVRQYMLLTGERLVGVSTEGEFLWGAHFPGSRAVCSDPVIVGDVMMASCAYNVGAYFYRISKEGDSFRAVYFHGPDLTLQSHHGGIVAVGDYFYLLTGGRNRDLACVRAATGEVVWRHPAVDSQGSLTYVDGMLILRSEGDGGTIALVEATPQGYRERGRFYQPHRGNRSAWAYPVVFDNTLFIRDDNVLLAFDLN